MLSKKFKKVDSKLTGRIFGILTIPSKKLDKELGYAMNRSQDEQIIIETIQKADPNNITFRSVEALENSYQETKSFKNIKATDVSFKIVTQIDHSSIIKKATYYINQVQDILQNLVFEVKKNGEQTTFQHINKLLFFIQNLRKELDLEEDNRLKELFQSKIHPFTCQSDFCDYAHKKPRGYPGDFLMMEKIWNGKLLTNTFI